MSIYVRNLSYEVKEDDLRQVFAEYRTVKNVQLPIDRETGWVRGFGFVEMESDAEETAAIEALDNAEWMGRSLKVNKAKPKIDGGSSGDRRGNSNESGGGYSRRY
ncbi:RNA recognition motif domain-containing protein [Nostoc sp.]|uniref:RNA recognition motif domain-containing protein n=1 Tax=Nostoc sp. TaxID=1180 RepID=UPI003593D0E6